MVKCKTVQKMNFKIVQTIEEGNLCLAIVPGAWEEKGVLWWPNQKTQVLKGHKRKQQSIYQTLMMIYLGL